ncbi:MAG: hypothetical protein JO101_05220 [Candidatus Eremiobacteraeota bacterium]|nr:hypothetical protein [Candidatus Eremiobacteraeota bacterium]MBV8354697.1 hypothetical protein [Candidatus Eremiobacteraeota bacterium]
MKPRDALFVALTCTMLCASGCSMSSEAKRQEQYSNMVANDVVTKFFLVDPTNVSRRFGPYAVVKTTADDRAAIYCTYDVTSAGTETPPPSTPPQVSAYVRVFRIEPNIVENKIYYRPVSADDARSMISQAPEYGEELPRISDVVAGRNTGYQPFPRDSEGIRHFIFTGCK